jgi:hypothetical protein
MPLQTEKQPDLIREVKIVIGSEWTSVRFAEPIPRADAMKRARVILELMA